VSIQSDLIIEIEKFCRETGIAESTFGRRVVNDGKFVGRLRDGKGITLSTVSKIKNYLSSIKYNATSSNIKKIERADFKHSLKSTNKIKKQNNLLQETSDLKKSAFRFYDNRQKYLMFVNTCNEKWVVAERVGLELAHIHPTPPSLRLFDAGMGDGTVITSVMREMHRRFRNLPFYIVGKEISLEDVRLSLEKMSDRFYEHPATVLVVTNLYYTEAPWLSPRTMKAAATLNWMNVSLKGDSAHEFHDQIKELQPMLAESWQVESSTKTGNPLYVRPSVLVLYREDQKFLLDQVIPKPAQNRADYDLVIASQPYRSRMPTDFKVKKVISPLAKSLRPGGRLLGIHSIGGDPGLDIIKSIWPDENPFVTNRHDLLKNLKKELGNAHSDLNYKTNSDKRSLFRYFMHTLPNEVGKNENRIGTSTLLAAWNAVTYVAQIEDERLETIMNNHSYLDATRQVLVENKGLWFNDESYVVSRKFR